VWTEETREIGRRFLIGTALVDLGRVTAPDGAHLTMSAADLPELAKDLGHPVLVPVHVEGWKHFRESRADAQALLADCGSTVVSMWPTPGVAMHVA